MPRTQVPTNSRPTAKALAADAQPSPWWIGWALAGLLLLAGGLRLAAVQRASLWLDEFWTLELALGHGTAHEHLPTNIWLASPPGLTSLDETRPWYTIWTGLGEVTHPPVFFLLLRGWLSVFGESELNLRLLPLLFSVAAVGLMYMVARRLHGPRVALLAAALMAVSGQQIYFAQEIRSYSLIVALSLAMCVLMLAIEQRGASWLRVAGISVMALLLVMTHYFAVGAVLAIAAYDIIRLKGRDRIRVVVGLAAAAVVFCAVWGPQFIAQRAAFAIEAGSGGAYFAKDTSPHPVRSTLVRLLTLPAQAFDAAAIGSRDDLSILQSVLLIVPAFLAVTLPLVWLRRSPALLMWYLWIAGVLLPLVVLDIARTSQHLAIPRYTQLASVGVFGILAAGYERLGRVASMAIPGVALLACAAFVPSSLQTIESEKPDWRPMATLLGESVAPGEPVIYTADGGGGAIVYLYTSHYVPRRPDRPAVILTSTPGAELTAHLRTVRRCWVVHAGSLDGLKSILPGAKVTVRGGVAGVAIFGDVTWESAEHARIASD